VSATARCSDTTTIGVSVYGSDPGGLENLGSCAAFVGTSGDNGSFNVEYASGSCYVAFSASCAVGDTFDIDLTVSNQTGGVTTALVRLVTSD
jgi:hypothetical protein